MFNWLPEWHQSSFMQFISVIFLVSLGYVYGHDNGYDKAIKDMQKAKVKRK